jgi:hypothetical protein
MSHPAIPFRRFRRTMAKVRDVHLRGSGESSNVNQTRENPTRLLDTVQRFVRLAQAAQDRRAALESADLRRETPADNPRHPAEQLK